MWFSNAAAASVAGVLLLVCLLQAVPPTAAVQSLVRMRGDNYFQLPQQRLRVIPMPVRTRTNMLARFPIFNGFRNLLRVIRPNVHIGRKSDYRSDFDENYINYHGAQLWKVMLGEHKRDFPKAHYEQRRDNITDFVQVFLEKFGTEVWNINQDGIDILIDARNIAKAKDFIAKTDFTYNIMIDDIETAIDETYMEVNNTMPNMPWLEREGSIMNWNRFHDIGDIHQFMQHLLELHPDLTEIIQIGLTSHKRPIEVLRVSNGDPQNWAVFIDAGMQGRDWLSPAAITLAISKLMWRWDIEPEYMRNIDWYFLPNANPDGYQYSRITDRLWTKNRMQDSKSGCFGVNLNRNFDYQWGRPGSSNNPCKNLYHGPKKFSESETKALRNFLHKIGDYLGGYVSLGGYGQVITFPWGDADFVTENYKSLNKVGKKAASNLRKLNYAEYRVGTSYRLKLARSGNSADWVQQRINPQFVYNVFLKDQGRYGYLMPPHYIVESGEEVYEFMKTIAAALN